MTLESRPWGPDAEVRRLTECPFCDEPLDGVAAIVHLEGCGAFREAWGHDARSAPAKTAR